MRILSSTAIFLSIALIGMIAPAIEAHALNLTVDLGAGMNKMQSPSPYFGTGLSSTNYGFSARLGAAISLVNPNSSVGVHAGIMHSLSNSSSGGSYFGLQATYPMLRVQTHNLFITAGITPFVWKRSGQRAAGFDNYSKSWGDIAILGEVGFDLPITPEISFVPTIATETVSSHGSMSPQPVFEGIASFRLFYGTSASGGGQHGKYEGYRYPLGIEIH